MLPFTNPRTVAEFDDWPIGGDLRGFCRFEVQTDPKRGQRVSRVTRDKNGRLCKPKYLTYARRMVIVDGSDGRTYILAAGIYRQVTIFGSDFKNRNYPGLNSAAVFGDSHPVEYATLLALFV